MKKKQLKKKQLNTMLVSFLTTLGVLAAAGLIVWLVVLPRLQNALGRQPLLANREVVPFHDHFSLDPDIPQVVLDDTRLREAWTPLVEQAGDTYRVYLPATFLRETVDPFLFWDDGANVFFVSTRQAMLEFVPDSASFLVNGASRPLETPIKRINGEVFLPADLIEGLYALVVDFQPAYNMVVITSALTPQVVAPVAVSSAAVRYRPESRAPIAIQLEQGAEVVVLGEANDEYTYVRTPQGLLGYVATADIGAETVVTPAAAAQPILGAWIDNTTPHPPAWGGGAINLVWEAAHNQDANARRMLTPFDPSVTVVSPTWFDFNRENLNLDSHVNREYVAWAHDQGVYVWPMVFDSYNAAARAILMNRDARRTVVQQLVDYVDEYNLDGINIDIEHLFNAEEGPYKIQFLRELAIPMRERGVVLSAAVKIPAPWTMFYRRDLIALTMDFVMVMTYDQHYQTSAVSGPVAGLNWVAQSLVDTLEEVPREQLLMGIPFYNRVWRETVLGDAPPSVRNLSMNDARQFFEERGVEWEWDSEIGSYYGEVGVIEEGEAVVYRVWLEDERSITAKMQLYVAHNLAGVASWRRGFESEEIWDVLGRYFP